MDSKYEEDPNYIEEVLDISKNLVKKLKVKFHSNATNEKRKTHKKSIDVLFVISYLLSIADDVIKLFTM